jgi:predicted DCC family thiol-disulfide oxidoreductase YuxK
MNIMNSDASAPTPAPVTVYYNSACPVCDAGIRGQRERMQGCQVEWVDVHTRPEVAAELGIGLEDLRERLHVRDAAGMHIGDRAFAALWRRTPGQRWLAWLPRLFGWLTSPLYKLAARLLYRWNRRRGHW